MDERPKIPMPSNLTWAKVIVLVDTSFNVGSGVLAFLLLTRSIFINPIATMITAIVLAAVEVVAWLVVLALRSRSDDPKLPGTEFFKYYMVLYAGHFFKMAFVNGTIALGMILYIARNGGVGADYPDAELQTDIYVWWHNFLVLAVGGALYALSSCSDGMLILFFIYLITFLAMCITRWGTSWLPVAGTYGSKAKNGTSISLNKGSLGNLKL